MYIMYIYCTGFDTERGELGFIPARSPSQILDCVFEEYDVIILLLDAVVLNNCCLLVAKNHFRSPTMYF